MSRDHRKLRVFGLADDLVVKAYRLSAAFPIHERYGLQSQLRRAAVSAACNIVEGCARRTTAEYLSFLNIASASATEARYLTELSCRLGFLASGDSDAVCDGYRELTARLQALISSLSPKS